MTETEDYDPNETFPAMLDRTKQVAKPGELPENWGRLDPPKYRSYQEKGTHEFMRTTVTKGKYDIDYVINLLTIIIDNCGHLSSPLSIKESCKKLVGYLKVEKCGKQPDARILVTCAKCKESIVIPKSLEQYWKCPCANNSVKNLEMLD
jgi:hypothetical protein